MHRSQEDSGVHLKQDTTASVGAIAALYRSFLRRDPDPLGLDASKYLVAEHGLERGLELIAGNILASEEYRGIVRHEFDYASALAEPSGRLIDGNQVSHIISLGTHCQTSSILKKHGLKAESYPFDWLFSSPSAVLHCIRDDFATFMDRSYYRSLPPYLGDDRAEHLFYLEKHEVQTFFPHRDPTTDADYGFFNRSVERFRKVIANDASKLFVIISREEHDLAGYFEALHAWVRRIGRSNILAIQLRNPDGGTSMRKLRSAECGDLYEFKPLSAEAGVGFPELIDELAILRLVTKYQIAGSARSS